MRKMICFKKGEHCLEIQTISKESRSSRFLMINKYVDDLLYKERTLDRDIYSFIELIPNLKENKLLIIISWLDMGGNKLKGEQERFDLDLKEFIIFWNDSERKSYKVLDLQNIKGKSVKIDVCCPERVRQVISQRELKRKFIKQLERLQNMNFDRVDLRSDFVDYSFYWEGFNNGKRSMNGGIIFHKDYKEPENLNKGKYSIHT